MADKISVDLQDAESGNVYSILVTREENARLQNDIGFATEKLLEAIQMQHNSITTDTTNVETDIIESVENETTTQESGAFKWPHEAIILLIEEYRIREKDFSSGKISQKRVWRIISEVMVKHGYNVTGFQYLSKFSGLKRTYKTVKDHNSKSGNGTRKWSYFSQMNDLLANKPFMSPVATASSSKRSPSECSTSSDSSIIDENPQSKKRRKSSLDNFSDELKEQWKVKEVAVEKRHQENLEIRERLLKSFENIIDILKKN